MKPPGNTVRVPVRVCYLSARAIEISPRSVLCSLNSVSVVDSWTPAASLKANKEPNSTTTVDLGVSIETDNLSADELHKAKELINRWSHIFSTGPTDLGKADIIKHEINLTDSTPFNESYRKIPPAMYDEVRQRLKEMLDSDAIRPSQSPYFSNVVLVRKKNGSLRFCIDFRKLNSQTIRMHILRLGLMKP